MRPKLQSQTIVVAPSQVRVPAHSQVPMPRVHVQGEAKVHGSGSRDEPASQRETHQARDVQGGQRGDSVRRFVPVN